jgi:hypothetical protein
MTRERARTTCRASPGFRYRVAMRDGWFAAILVTGAVVMIFIMLFLVHT